MILKELRQGEVEVQTQNSHLDCEIPPTHATAQTILVLSF